MGRLHLVFLSILFSALMACSPKTDSFNAVSSPVLQEPLEIPQETPVETPPENPAFRICSKLDLSQVQWPSELSVPEWEYYALALNITGSFEGHDGWKNIANDQDKQGMSLGLMQQNLGQGTLQPLLVEMYRQNNSTMLSLFSARDYSSVKGMLEAWLNAPVSPSAFSLQGSSNELFPKDLTNKLDVGFDESIQSQANNVASSLTWARQNLFDSRGQFLSNWKKSFQDMAASSDYRTLQLLASTDIFLKAKHYFEYFNFTELRFLLLMFDIVVQNGGFNQNHLNIYNNWLAQNPLADEQARALAIIEARITTVNPIYKDDVRARKTSIVYGTGTVHGARRNYATEYCADLRTIVQN